MSTVTIQPDATISASAGTLTGAGTAHGCLGDNNDSTYIVMYAGGGDARVSVATPTKPAGAVTKHFRGVFDCASISVNTTKFDVWVEYLGLVRGGLTGQTITTTTVQNFATEWLNLGDLSAAELSELVCGVRRSLTGAVTNLRAVNAEIQVVFALVPTVACTASFSGTSTSVSWVHTPGDDGGPQSHYRAWLTLDSSGFAAYDTGIVAGSASTATVDGIAAGNYTWHVQTAQNINGVLQWSAEDTDTVTLTPTSTAEVDTLVATPDPLQAVIEVEITRDTGEDAWDSVELFRLAGDDVLGATGDMESGSGGVADGWVIEQLGTLTGVSSSLQTTTAEDGQYQRMSATTDAGEFLMMLGDFWPCDAGDTIQAECRVRGTGEMRLSVSFFAEAPRAYAPGDGWLSGPATLSGDGAQVTLTSSWQTLRLTITAPAGTSSFRIGPHLGTAASGGTWTVDVDQVRAYRSTDGWVESRTPVVLDTDDATAYDFEAPPATLVLYRARALNAGGAVGSWVYAEPVEWEAEDAVWFKPLGRPDLTMQLCLAERPTLSRPRQSVVIPILGSPHRVVRSDVLNSTEWDLLVETETAADAAAFLALCESNPSILLQFPTEYDMLGPHMWVSVLDVQEAFQSPVLGVYYRVWQLRVVEIGTP